MPSYRPAQCSKRKPWAARVRWQGLEYYLGAYSTKEEAKEAEDEFKRSVGV